MFLIHAKIMVGYLSLIYFFTKPSKLLPLYDEMIKILRKECVHPPPPPEDPTLITWPPLARSKQVNRCVHHVFSQGRISSP